MEANKIVDQLLWNALRIVPNNVLGHSLTKAKLHLKNLKDRRTQLERTNQVSSVPEIHDEILTYSQVVNKLTQMEK